MKRNKILANAVVMALGCTGTAMAQDTPKCAEEAMRLHVEIEQSAMTDAEKAEFTQALREAQSADLVRCERVLARVQGEVGANDENSAPSERPGYPQGHASAGESLPSHPGAAAHDSGVSATGEPQEGYASADATLKSEAEATDAGKRTDTSVPPR